MSFQFRDKAVMRDSVKCFAPAQIEYISCSSLIHQHSNPVIEGHQICQSRFAPNEAVSPVTNQLLIFQVP